ncbi:MAG TPA: hypothetical protein VF832_12260 [Longimicrobiales bacterium]
MPDTEFAPEIHAERWEPRTVGDARDAISDTRERISATLDAIEARIDDTKAEIRRRADVLRPVRERIVADPWRALAIGAGAGLALGLLTGGSDEPKPRRSRGRRARAAARKRAREYRAEHEPQRRVARQIDHWEDELREIPENVRELPDKIRQIPEKVSDVAQDVRDYTEERLAPSQHASMGERFVDHLLHALADAVTDGLSQRFRRAATD